MCVAISLSPRLNHTSPPSLSNCCKTVNVSPRIPHPLHGVTQTRERIHDRIEVGGNIEAMEDEIVGGVADDGQLGGIDFVAKAFNQLSTARAAGEND